jgi:putative hemolysin
MSTIGVDLPEGDYTTVAGLVLDRLGHLPAVGEELAVGRWILRVRATRHRAVTELVLVPLTPSVSGEHPPGPGEEAGDSLG